MASSENATNLLKPLTDCCIANSWKYFYFFAIHWAIVYPQLITTNLNGPLSFKYCCLCILRRRPTCDQWLPPSRRWDILSCGLGVSYDGRIRCSSHIEIQQIGIVFVSINYRAVGGGEEVHVHVTYLSLSTQEISVTRLGDFLHFG